MEDQQLIARRPERLIAIDLSSKPGFAVFVNGAPDSWGTVFPTTTAKDLGEYPMNFIALADEIVARLVEALRAIVPDLRAAEFVVEETNVGKNAFSQKLLEFMHYALIQDLCGLSITPRYVRTGAWRQVVDAKMTREEKSLNARIARIKLKTGKKLAKIDGKVVGRRGRKHVSIRTANTLFGLSLQRKDEDAAEALLIGAAYLRGCPLSDGTPNGGKVMKKNTEAA